MNIPKSTILLVEDDYLTQLHASMILEDAGHEVLIAIDGEDALAMAATRPDITALFTDIGLPGAVDGLDLAHAIRRSHPGSAIIVTSGLEPLAADALPEGAVFMAKPYTAAQMRRALGDSPTISTYAGRR